MVAPQIGASGHRDEQLRRRESVDFLNQSSLPSWLSKYGGSSTTLTFGDTATNNGDLNIETANVDGGIVGPEVDISLFSEVRVGATFEPHFSVDDAEWWGMGWSEQSTAFHDTTDGDFVDFGWYDNDTHLEVFGGGNRQTEVGRVLPNMAIGNGPISFELRLQPESAAMILAHDGRTVSYRDMTGYDTSLTFHPAIGIDSSLGGTTKTMDVRSFYYEIVE